MSEDKKSKPKKKWYLRWWAFVLYFFIILIVIGFVSEEPNNTNDVSQSNDDSQAESSEPKTPETPEAKIERLVSSNLKGKNNMGKNNLREVKVVEQIDGGWGVFVDFNAGDNITTKLRRQGIESDMSELYKVLYTNDLDVKTATVSAYFPVVDKYGNDSDGIVYKTSLDKEEADKINWDYHDATLKLDIIPSVWTPIIVHPGFK